MVSSATASSGTGPGGDGDRTSGVTVIGVDGDSPLTGVARVDTGIKGSCAVLISGGVVCWGANDFVQLGDGGVIESAAVAHAVTVMRADGEAIVPLLDVTDVALGESHSCALTETGRVMCWGYGFAGRLGNGSEVSSPFATPVMIDGGGDPAELDDVVEIDVGAFHACARLAAGSLVCWGYGGAGVLGGGSFDTEVYATPVSGITTATALTTGDEHTCVVLADTTARCWGANHINQLGDGTSDGRNAPVAVRVETGGAAATGFADISAGKEGTCARMTNGGARCWGYGPDGQLGTGSIGTSAVPVTVMADGTNPLGGVLALSSGGDHTCVRLAAGRLRCWGYNLNGQVGDGTTDYRTLPTAVTAL